MTTHEHDFSNREPSPNATQKFRRIIELRRQLRIEMKIAGYRATDLFDATDDAILREIIESGADDCATFLALWVATLRDGNSDGAA